MTSQIVLISQPRSGSHLLARMLGESSDVIVDKRPFGDSRGPQIKWLQTENYRDGMSPDVRAEYDAGIQKGIKEWREALATIEVKGSKAEQPTASNKAFVFTHVFFEVPPERMLSVMETLQSTRSDIPPTTENFTLAPDDILLHPGTVPVFSIRNPHLAVPSALVTTGKMGLPHCGGRPNFMITTGLIWSRMLYDWYVSKGVQPLIVNADDYMTNEDYVRFLYTKLALDPAQLHLAWKPSTEQEIKETHPMFYASQSTLIRSSELDPSRAPKNVDLDEEVRSWDERFGEEDAALVKEMVGFAMPHYRYLDERRLRMR